MTMESLLSQMFILGTNVTLLGKPKFVALADEIYSRKSCELWKALPGFAMNVESEKLLKTYMVSRTELPLDQNSSNPILKCTNLYPADPTSPVILSE